VHPAGVERYHFNCGRIRKIAGLVWRGITGRRDTAHLLSRTHLPIGRLPGDFLYRGKNTRFYFPLVTSLILSVVLSLVLYLISRFKQ